MRLVPFEAATPAFWRADFGAGHGGAELTCSFRAAWFCHESLRERETTASCHGSDALTPLSSLAADLVMQVEFEPEESARLPPCVPDDVLARIGSEWQLKPRLQY